MNLFERLNLGTESLKRELGRSKIRDEKDLEKQRKETAKSKHSKYLSSVEARKAAQFEFQKQQAAKKEERDALERKRKETEKAKREKEEAAKRQEAERYGLERSQVKITGQDSDAAAAEKIFSNLGSTIGHGVRKFTKKMDDRIDKEKLDASVNRFKSNFKKGVTQKFNVAKGAVKTRIKKFFPQKPRQPLDAISRRGPQSTRQPLDAISRRGPQSTRPPLDATSRRGANIQDGYEYEFSCWREEFLYELGDLRKKARAKDDDKIIDVMRGENKITLNPTVSNETFDYNSLSETTNGASIFAKATPPILKRTTPMSDVHLSKQPGRGTAEKVEALMRKLFLGDVKGYTSNYDLSLTHAAQNKIGEAYDENDETFRQHSQERFTAGVGDGTRARRTASVIKRIAAMSQDVEPSKKKKKKKKKEENN